jgi:branched-chain amino acid transport system substrate-binding protein
MKGRVFFIVIVAVSVLGFLSVWPVVAQEAPKTIKIGALVALTGPDAASGLPAKLGYDLAVEEINKTGGVMVKMYGKRIPLELVPLDTETNPEKAIARVETFHSRDVTVAVGTTLVGAAAEIFEKNKVPVIASLMTINAVMDRGFKYFFNTGALNSDIVDLVFDAFASLGKGVTPTKWAFLKEQSEFSTELFQFAKEAAAKRGITITYEGQYTMMAPDLSALIMGAKNSGAEVLFAFPTAPDGITLLKQMAQLGYKPKAKIFIRASNDPSWGKLGPLGDDVIGAPDWHPAFNFPGVKELNAAVLAKTGQPTNPSVGPSYAAIKVAAAAIEKAGTLDRAAVRDAIAATNMMTVTGQVRFSPKNNTRINAVRPLIQWQNGSMDLVWPVDQRNKPMVYPIPYGTGNR